LCEAVARIRVDAHEQIDIRHTGQRVEHPLLQRLAARRAPGVVIFSSGSTGTSKAAVHELEPLLDKFRDPGRVARVVAFLLLDHIGGLNLLFYTLFAGGAVVVPEDRSPDAVCASIELHRATALTTTPTFLRLALLCKAFQRHDVSSLRVINYSSEVMAESTLRALAYALPGVRLSQAYGLTEVGVLPVQSIASNSVLLRVTGDGSNLRVRDGMLEVKTKSTMLGYLNAPSPLTEDGWLRTGDAVEVEGDCLRILGRASDLINVGGHKVYPAEVEGVLQDVPGVLDVVVTGQPHAITGSLVQVAVRLASPESLLDFSARMRAYCRGRLPSYMVPQKVVQLEQPLHSRRFKKIRAKGSVHDGTG
jgi:acyl-CoA synthetase (AMP-forming)/AMP-acid ligase II